MVLRAARTRYYSCRVEEAPRDMKHDPETILANTIRQEVWRLRERLSLDPVGPPLIWTIPARLGCSQRPLRDHPGFQDTTGRPLRPLPRRAGPEVIAWAHRVRTLGVASMICLMHSKELRYYDGLEGMPSGLLDLY